MSRHVPSGPDDEITDAFHALEEAVQKCFEIADRLCSAPDRDLFRERAPVSDPLRLASTALRVSRNASDLAGKLVAIAQVKEEQMRLAAGLYGPDEG